MLNFKLLPKYFPRKTLGNPIKPITTKTECHTCSTQQQFRHFFCEGCSNIISPSTLAALNHFELFNLYLFTPPPNPNPNPSPEVFHLNPKTLETKFRSYQKLVHPDKFLSRDDDGALHSQTKEIVKTINHAYQFLLNDFERANYVVLPWLGKKFFTHRKVDAERSRFHRGREPVP